MTDLHAAQLDAILSALAEGDHDAADAVAAMTPEELADLFADEGEDEGEDDEPATPPAE